jgi:hypothetical protein
MKTPDAPAVPGKQPVKKAGPRGRFVGLVAVAPETYQVVVLDTEGVDEGIEIVDISVPERGREKQFRGKMVSGVSLAVAFSALNTAVAKSLRDNPSELWAHFSE